jgi:hypothetical protein
MHFSHCPITSSLSAQIPLRFLDLGTLNSYSNICVHFITVRNSLIRLLSLPRFLLLIRFIFENVQISVASNYFEILKICVNFQISGIFLIYPDFLNFLFDFL